jgi:hypothetical protein
MNALINYYWFYELWIIIDNNKYKKIKILIVIII